MLKRNEKIFNFFQQLIDAICVAGTWYIAFTIRFNIFKGQSGLGILFLKLSIVLIILTIYFFHKNKLYHSQRFNSRMKEIFTVLKANTQAILTFIIVLYFFAPDRISRSMLIIYFIISQFVLVTIRIMLRNFLRTLRKRGMNLRHILLVGHGNQMKNYIETIRKYKDAGIVIIGWIDSGDLHAKLNIQAMDIPLSEAIKKYSPDTIVIGYPGSLSHQTESVLKACHNGIIPIQVLPDLTYSFIGHHIDEFAGIPVLSFNQPNLSLLDHALKRSFDFILTFIGLLFLSPLLAVIAIIVKLGSKGPIFYGQERMGLDGKKFLMWKFRSMKADAENTTGAVWAVKDDPRRTKIGTFLRSTSLDELPQLWNVLVGDMSLVGPRPERPVFVDKFKNDIPAYMLRHKMKTGITGWAQVNGWRGDTSLHKRIECDIYYIKNWSIWLDIRIIFLTFFKGFINKNAY